MTQNSTHNGFIQKEFDEFNRPITDPIQHRTQQQAKLDRINQEYSDSDINFMPCYPPEEQADDDYTNNQLS